MSRLIFLHDGISHFGGAERILLQVAELASHESDLDLGILWGDHDARLDARARTIFEEVTPFSYPARAPRLGSLRAYRNATRRLHEWLDAKRPRAVLAFALRSALYAAPWTRRREVPLVWVCQQMLPLYEPPLGDLKQALLFRFLLRANPWFVALSEHSHAQLGGTGVAPDHLVYIPNGVDLEHFSPTTAHDRTRERGTHQIPDADLVAVCVARLDPYKDHETLIRSLALAAARGTRIVAACVGVATEPGHERRLKELARDLGVEGQLIWAGGREDVRPWLALADAVVLPSTRECASLALLEAGATATPVVASRVGGNPNVIRHEDTGLLFEAGDADALATHLIDLATHPDRRSALATRIHQVVQRDFDKRDADHAWSRFVRDLPGTNRQ